MSKVVIIADDLTGANATSVLLVRQGFKAVTFLNLDKYDGEEHKDLNVVSISTDSRGVEGEVAYHRVKDVVDFFKDEEVGLFAKRIDSTLRGNIGSEISAMLDNLDEDTLAIVVEPFSFLMLLPETFATVLLPSFKVFPSNLNFAAIIFSLFQF